MIVKYIYQSELFIKVIYVTVRVPNSHRVGSGPAENIILKIVDATRVLIPDSLGRVITIAADISITAQINPDK